MASSAATAGQLRVVSYNCGLLDYRVCGITMLAGPFKAIQWFALLPGAVAKQFGLRCVCWGAKAPVPAGRLADACAPCSTTLCVSMTTIACGTGDSRAWGN